MEVKTSTMLVARLTQCSCMSVGCRQLDLKWGVVGCVVSSLASVVLQSAASAEGMLIASYTELEHTALERR
jgi:uncharacterized protein with NRDE domain